MTTGYRGNGKQAVREEKRDLLKEASGLLVWAGSVGGLEEGVLLRRLDAQNPLVESMDQLGKQKMECLNDGSCREREKGAFSTL